jgi:hypothetical protein
MLFLKKKKKLNSIIHLKLSCRSNLKLCKSEARKEKNKRK